MVNREQKDNWNGVSGAEWVRRQDRYDRMLQPWADVLASAAAVVPGERVLDLGCGCGTTTRAAAGQAGPEGLAVGFDVSEPMLAQARRRAADDGVGNVRFVLGDAQVDDLAAASKDAGAGPGQRAAAGQAVGAGPGSRDAAANGATVAGPNGDAGYDLAISRYGVMFFDDPVAAFANVEKAMRPGGRLAVVTWAPLPGQEWILVPAAAAASVGVAIPAPPGANGDDGGTVPGMFSLSQPERIAAVLAGAGWVDVETTTEQRTILFAGGGTLDEAMDFFASSGPGRNLLADATPAEASRALAAIRTAMEPHVTARGVEFEGVACVTRALPSRGSG